MGKRGRVSPEILDRLPPQNLEAERAVLGSILLSKEVFPVVRAVIDKGCFYADAHKVLFARLEAMTQEGLDVGDIALVRAMLKDAGKEEAVGGAAYLAEILQSVPCSANAVHYANIVRQKAAKRGAVHVSLDLIRDAYDDGVTAGEWYNKAITRLKKMRQWFVEHPKGGKESDGKPN